MDASNSSGEAQQASAMPLEPQMQLAPAPLPEMQQTHMASQMQQAPLSPTPASPEQMVQNHRQVPSQGYPQTAPPGPPMRGSVVMQGDRDVASFGDDDELEVMPAAAAAVIQAEPEPDTSLEGPLKLSTRIEYKSLPVGQTQDVFGLVTVQAGASKPPSSANEPQRQPTDIIAVLDVSGSMQSGGKLQQVQDATRFIIKQSEPKDRLGLVAFNSIATRVLRLRKMNAEGKNDGNVSTLRLQAGGGTSIAAGLDMALSVMEQRRQRNKVSAILLLTDGQDRSTQSRLPSLLRRAAQANVAIYAFGFGSDHDAGLLGEIAEQAQTPFTFVEDTDTIREAFAGCVGGLSSIVAQKVELTLRCMVPLKTVHTPFPLQQTEREATVTIPDMFAGERRDILVELAVPADQAGVVRTVLLEASARYTDLCRDVIVQTAPIVMEAERVEEPQPEAEPDEEVSAQRERVEVSRALKDAAQASDSGQFDEALQVIASCDARMKSAQNKTPVSEALGLELEDARTRMRTKQSWEQGGRAEMKDACQMHSMQRCTNAIHTPSSPQKSSKSMYMSVTQGDWINKSKGNSSSWF